MQNLALKLLDTTDKVCNRRLKNPVARTFWNKIGKSHAVKNIMESTDAELKVDMNQNVSHKFTVNRAWPSEKKAYPIRWLIVVVSTMSAFIFGVLVIIGIENYQRVVSRKES